MTLHLLSIQLVPSYSLHGSLLCYHVYTVCMYASCHKDPDSEAFISLDGDFRLCHRKKAGQRSVYDKPLNVDGIFVNQSDVDCYVQSSALLVTLERSRVKQGTF